MNDITVETEFQFEKLMRTIVHRNMDKLKAEHEWLVVELMTQCFKYGILFEKNGYVIVKGDKYD